MKPSALHSRLRLFFLPTMLGLSLVLSAQAAQFAITTNANAEFSSSLAFDGTNYLVGIQGDELAATNITAQSIGSTGTLLGSRIKVGRTGSSPTVAFDGANYLAVWRDERNGNANADIYGQLISPAGTLIGSEIAISTQTGKQRHPAAAFDGTNYLTVWISSIAGGWDSYGRFISRAGIPGSLFRISQTIGASENTTSVAFDGTSYLVAWERDIGLGPPNPELGDIYCRFVSPSGSFPGNEFAFVTDPGNQVFPSLSFDGANYLLSWSDGLGTTNSQVRFQFLNPAGVAISSPFTAFTAVGTNVPLFGGILFDGKKYAVVTTLGVSNTGLHITPGDVYACFISPLPRGAFPIAITSSNEFALFAAFDGTNYLAAIQNRATSIGTVTAQLFSPTGALIGPRLFTGGVGSLPEVAIDGINYLMVWRNSLSGQIHGQRISRSPALVGLPFQISSSSGVTFFGDGPEIAFDGSNYLVVWRDERNDANNSDIYGQLVSPAGTLQGSEIPISTDPERQKVPAVAFDGTNYFIVWQSRRSGSTEAWDTYGKFISKAGVPGSALLISQNPSSSFNPMSLAFDGTNYLVVWSRDIGPGFPSPADWDIYARLVTSTGVFVGNEFPITTAIGSQPFFGGLNFDGANYLVSGIDVLTSSLKHRFFNRSGVPLTAEFSLFGSQGTRSPIGGLGFDGSRFFALVSYLDSNFSNGDVYGLILPRHRVDLAGPVANGQVPLRFTGMPGVTYAIHGTTNLLSANTVWTTLTTSNTLNGTFNFTDTNAASFSRRFYRAVQQ